MKEHLKNVHSIDNIIFRFSVKNTFVQRYLNIYNIHALICDDFSIFSINVSQIVSKLCI